MKDHLSSCFITVNDGQQAQQSLRLTVIKNLVLSRVKFNNLDLELEFVMELAYTAWKMRGKSVSLTR